MVALGYCNMVIRKCPELMRSLGIYIILLCAALDVVECRRRKSNVSPSQAKNIIIATVVIIAFFLCCALAMRKCCPRAGELTFDDISADDFSHRRPEFSFSLMKRITAVKNRIKYGSKKHWGDMKGSTVGNVLQGNSYLFNSKQDDGIVKNALDNIENKLRDIESKQPTPDKSDKEKAQAHKRREVIEDRVSISTEDRDKYTRATAAAKLAAATQVPSKLNNRNKDKEKQKFTDLGKSDDDDDDDEERSGSRRYRDINAMDEYEALLSTESRRTEKAVSKKYIANDETDGEKGIPIAPAGVPLPAGKPGASTLRKGVQQNIDLSKISFPPKNIARPAGITPPPKLLAVQQAQSSESTPASVDTSDYKIQVKLSNPTAVSGTLGESVTPQKRSESRPLSPASSTRNLLANTSTKVTAAVGGASRPGSAKFAPSKSAADSLLANLKVSVATPDIAPPGIAPPPKPKADNQNDDRLTNNLAFDAPKSLMFNRPKSNISTVVASSSTAPKIITAIKEDSEPDKASISIDPPQHSTPPKKAAPESASPYKLPPSAVQGREAPKVQLPRPGGGAASGIQPPPRAPIPSGSGLSSKPSTLLAAPSSSGSGPQLSAKGPHPMFSEGRTGPLPPGRGLPSNNGSNPSESNSAGVIPGRSGFGEPLSSSGLPPGIGPPRVMAPLRTAQNGDGLPMKVPSGVAPPGFAPPSIAPPRIAPPSMAPRGIAPPSIAPPGIAPPSMAPRGIAPPSIAPPGIASPSMAPRGIAPPSVAPPGIAPPRLGPPGIARIGPPRIAPPGRTGPTYVAPPGIAPPGGIPANIAASATGGPPAPA